MKIIFYHNGSGAAYWRLADPLNLLPRDQFEVTAGNGIDETAEKQDVFVLQSVVDKEKLAYLYALQQEEGKKIVCDVDDYLELDEDNPHYVEHKQIDANFTIKSTLRIADMVTTTNEYLAKQLREYNKNVVILPNYMDLRRWDGLVRENVSKEIRILWAGSITHRKDLEMIEKPMKKILDEYPNVKFVAMGDLRIKEAYYDHNVEVRLGVPFEVYPNILRGMQADIGIAPLRDTEFNRCKSGIKVLEYSMCRIPCVASDVEPYKGTKALLAQTDDDWYEILSNLIENKKYRQELGQEAYRDTVQNHDLSKKVSGWVEAYKSLE
jgi:O-antigen biosynthesis protein